jgi:hypothetical protein
VVLTLELEVVPVTNTEGPPERGLPGNGRLCDESRPCVFLDIVAARCIVILIGDVIVAVVVVPAAIAIALTVAAEAPLPVILGAGIAIAAAAAVIVAVVAVFLVVVTILVVAISVVVAIPVVIASAMAAARQGVHHIHIGQHGRNPTDRRR